MASDQHPGPGADATGEQVLRELFTRIDQGRWTDLAELYSPDVVVLNQTAPPGAPTSSRGREAVAEFFGYLSSTLRSLRVADLTVWATTGSGPAVAEARFVGQSSAGPFDMPVLFVSWAREGLIVESHDYLGPTRTTSAAGG